MWINTKLFKNWLWSHELFLNSLDLDFRPVLLFTERRATLQNSRCEFAVLWTYSFDVFAPWVYHVPVLLLVQNNVHVPSLCDSSYFYAISVNLNWFCSLFWTRILEQRRSFAVCAERPSCLRVEGSVASEVTGMQLCRQFLFHREQSSANRIYAFFAKTVTTIL